MKESRFIELLNLYVDQQLSPSEAAELEAEILKDAGRRQTYQQYCRMQKACTLLFEKERTHAPSAKLASAVVDADRKIVAFPKSRSHWARTLYPVAVAAAAACVAIVFVRHDSSPRNVTTSAPVVAQTPAATPAAQPVAVAVDVTPAAQQKPEYFPVLAPRRLFVDRQSQPEEQIPAVVPRDTLGSYAWLNTVELPPVPTLVSDKLSLENSPSNPAEDRVLRSSKPVRGKAEMSAFQFQR